jgi:conjugative transfer region lipoprotein (TIGR03751 family)
MLKITYTLILSAALISLNACSSISGNVVPQSGPGMEKVYDSMKKPEKEKDWIAAQPLDKRAAVRNDFQAISASKKRLNEFHKIPNPELQMYIYPHLAGRDQIPVPGYTTAFNVYERDHYEI